MMRMSTPGAVLIGLLVLAFGAGCSSAGGQVSSTESEPAVADDSGNAGISPPDESITLIRGLVSCRITSANTTDEGDNQIVQEHFRCTYATNDPRLSGAVEGDFTTTVEPASAASARWEGSLTITNDGGSWKGREKGALVFWSAGPSPYNYGEGTYEGTGAYEGLTYHELIAGSNYQLTVAGWVEPTE